jgi:ABC-type multidrug transport system fused ATPase/permease subunit
MLTIAHRLNTIVNSNMVAVMSAGSLVEYGSPNELMRKSESEFSKLLKELEKK